jgi:hypothetical protein
MRPSILPALGSFLLAVAIASLSPSTRSLGRAAGESTGCTVNTTVNATLDSRTRTVGDKSIRDDKKKDIKDEINAGLQDMGVDTTDNGVKQDVGKTLDDVEKKNLDAVTFVDLNETWKPAQVDNSHWVVTVTCKYSVVTLLPSGASDTLKAHEAGHKQIAESTKEFAKTKFKSEIDKASCDNASIKAAFDSAQETVHAVFDAANKDYDDKTKNGTVGDAAAQLAQAANSFATASAGK